MLYDISHNFILRFRQQDRKDKIVRVKGKNMLMDKTFDIAIPVYRPDEKFDCLIRRILKQEVLPKKLILTNTECEECSSEDLLARVEQIRDKVGEYSVDVEVISVQKTEFDHGGTRHLATCHSKSDYLLFMTQDAVPCNRELTEELLESFENSEDRVAVVYGRQLASKQAGVTERITREFNYPKKSRVKTAADIDELGIKTFFCSDVCAMYDLRTSRMLGGFVRKTIFNEDMLYAAKAIDAGYAVAYCADAKVVHSHSYSYEAEFKRNFDLAVSQKQHPEVFAYVSSEKEGVRFVLDTVKKLAEQGLFLEIVDFGIRTVAKYAGYLLGKNYEKIPPKCREMFSMNNGYWAKEK